MNNLSIIPECYGDTLLLEMLGFKRLNHQTSGIGQVIKVMRDKYQNRLAIGVIDADKKITPTYFQEFFLEKEKNGIKLLKHKNQRHFLIMVSPALEGFLLNAALEVELQSKSFDSLKKLKRITKSQYVSQNQEFKSFLNTLRQKKASGFLTIQNWLKEYGFECEYY